MKLLRSIGSRLRAWHGVALFLGACACFHPHGLLAAFDTVAAQLTSPGKRLFVGYLFSASLLAGWVFFRSGARGSFLGYLFPRRLWLSDSAQVDYKLVAFNSFVKVALVAQFLVYGLHMAFEVEGWLSHYLGGWSGALSPAQTVLAYTLALTVFGDLSVYILHRMMHRVPALWAVHRVHHSATTLTPVTQLRLHPLELILNNLRSIFVFGLVTGVFDFLSSGAVSKLTFVGVNIFAFAFFSFGANLRHSHIRLGYWRWAEHLFISPLQHQVHHSESPEHHDRNFGSKLAIWDWLGGTLVTSKDVGELRFGLGEATASPQTLRAALLAPFMSSPGEDLPTAVAEGLMPVHAELEEEIGRNAGAFS